MKNSAAVITTINRYKDTFCANYQDHGYDLVIVGDKKTPHDTYNKTKYLHPNKKLFDSDIEKKLPFNHYCRKNLGYIHAIHENYDSILDTDDDNYPTADIMNWKQLKIEKITSKGLPNILKKFYNKPIWSRGYPLEQILKTDSKIITQTCNNADIQKVGVVQSLVNGDPDVDAIYRLTSPHYTQNTRFTDGIGFIFAKETYTQGNTQATLWLNKKLFHLLYIPTTVTFRFCDILKMYVAQRCMWELDSQLAVVSPYFEQKRNAHDYMCDFRSETSMYVCLYRLLTRILPEIKLCGDIDDIIRVYEQLEKNNITTGDELPILKEYINTIQQ